MQQMCSVLAQLRLLNRIPLAALSTSCCNALESRSGGIKAIPTCAMLALQQRALAQQAGHGNDEAADEARKHIDTIKTNPSDIASSEDASGITSAFTARNSSRAGTPQSSATIHAETPAAEQVVPSTSPSASTAVTAQQPAAASNASPSSTTSVISPALLAHISSTINRLTGYESIDHLKGSVATADQQLQECKRQLHAAKLAYEQHLATQSQLHREVTALLQRKSSWVPSDVSRFTELYAAEHQTEAAVAAAKSRYSSLSDEAERLQLQLVDLIRERYQQEQLWSDKIRRASTWWTWGLMGLHFASFVLVYTFLEPRKRAALQAAVADMLQQHMISLDSKLLHLPLAPSSTAAAGGEGEEGAELQQEKQQEQQQLQLRSQLATDASHSWQTVGDVQQQVLKELQLVKHQLQSLQQALPGAAAAAAAAAVAAEQPSSSSRWHLPGSQWVAHHLTSAGRSAAAIWQSSKHMAQQMVAQSSSRRAQGLQHEGGSSSSSSDVANDSDGKDSVQGNQALEMLAEHQQRQQHEQRATEPANHTAAPRQGAAAEAKQQAGAAELAVSSEPTQPPAAGSALRPGMLQGLLQQWKSGSNVLEVTRSQLAAVAAGAGAAGAALAAVAVVMLKSGRGGSS